MARGRKKGSKDKKKRIMSPNSLENLNKRPTLEKRNEYLSRSSKRNIDVNYEKYKDLHRANLKKIRAAVGDDADLKDYSNRMYSRLEFETMRKAAINSGIKGNLNKFLADRAFKTSSKQTRAIEEGLRRSRQNEGLGPISRKEHWEIRVLGTQQNAVKQTIEAIYQAKKEEKIAEWMKKNPGKSREEAMAWGLGFGLSAGVEVGQEFFGS